MPKPPPWPERHKGLIVLGIDPNTTESGLAVIEAENAPFFSASLIVDTVLFTESLKLGAGALVGRYFALAQRVEELCIHWQPAGVAIESTYVGENPQTGLKLATALGAALYAAARHVPVDDIYLLSPAEIKSAITGHSQASKEAVMLAVEYTTGTKPATQHIADAIAVARTLGDRLRLERMEERRDDDD